MDINSAFPSSNYLKSADLKGQIVSLQISHITYETIGTDQKLVMYFQGKQKGMVLNKTNAQTIAEAYGSDTDNWVGANINVFSMKVDFQGKLVDGLRVKVPPRRITSPGQTSSPPQGSPRVMPNARQAQQPQQPQQQMEPTMASADDRGDPFDDEIPF